jgi:hypothetical protein
MVNYNIAHHKIRKLATCDGRGIFKDLKTTCDGKLEGGF